MRTRISPFLSGLSEHIVIVPHRGSAIARLQCRSSTLTTVL